LTPAPLGEAISAVKALQKASAAGQRIYHITPANQSTILGNIHHDADTMTEIKNALAAGKEVITHTDAVNVPGWSGAGYIITDPDTGAGAYKIAGGGNGGFFLLAAFFFAIMTFIFLFFASLPAIGLLAATILYSTVAFSIISFIASIIALLSLADADADRTAFIDWGGLAMATLGVTAAFGTAGLGAALLGFTYALAAVINDFPK